MVKDIVLWQFVQWKFALKEFTKTFHTQNINSRLQNIWEKIQKVPRNTDKTLENWNQEMLQKCKTASVNQEI